MIARIWHGWTSHENADKYEKLVRGEVFEKVEKLDIVGYQGMQLLRKEQEHETEFISMMWFEKLEDVTGFVGEDIETAHVPDTCQNLLSRFEKTVNHFEVRQQLSYNENK